MKKILTRIDFSSMRSQDTYFLSSYPKKIEEATSFLVRENQEEYPFYGDRPSGLPVILHTAGYISDEQMEALRESYGMNDPYPYSASRLCEKVNHNWGRNLFRSLLLLGNSFNKEKALAFDNPGEHWQYEFKPGIVPLGKSGRILEKDGELYEEELEFVITPDLIYDSLARANARIENIMMKVGDTYVCVYNEGEEVSSRFQKNRLSKKGFKEGSNYKKIKLSDFRNWKEFVSPFYEQVKFGKGNYVFDTDKKYDSFKQRLEDYALRTDNLVWKLAYLNRNDPNNFVCESTWRMYHQPHIYSSDSQVGSTGRSVKIANRKSEDGFEYPSNWQTEYTCFEITPSMVTNALFSLDDISRLITFDQRDSGGPWLEVYNKEKNISPENKREFMEALVNTDDYEQHPLL